MPERFTYVKRGYDPEEVDKYIDTLESVVKSYKEKDNVIKNAIVSAQMAADNIVKNAELKAEDTKAHLFRQLENIINSLDTQRTLVKDFQDEYNTLVKKYLTDFNESDIKTLNSKINDIQEYIAKLNPKNEQ